VRFVSETASSGLGRRTSGFRGAVGFGSALAMAPGTGTFGGGEAGFFSTIAGGRFGETLAVLPPAVLVGLFAVVPVPFPVTFPFWLAATAGRFEDPLAVAFAAAAFPAAVAPERAGVFPRPAPTLTPAGRPTDDVRLGFARRFAFAMRPRYLHIQRNVNGAPRCLRQRKASP